MTCSTICTGSRPTLWHAYSAQGQLMYQECAGSPPCSGTSCVSVLSVLPSWCLVMHRPQSGLQLVEKQGSGEYVSCWGPVHSSSTSARRARTKLRSIAVSSPSARHFRQVRPRQSLAGGAATLRGSEESFMTDLRGGVGMSLLARGGSAMPPFRGNLQPESGRAPPFRCSFAHTTLSVEE